MNNIEIRGDELSNKILDDYLDRIYREELKENNKKMVVYTKKKRKILSMILKRKKYYEEYTTKYKILEEKVNSTQISGEQKKECLEMGKKKIIKEVLKHEYGCIKVIFSFIDRSLEILFPDATPSIFYIISITLLTAIVCVIAEMFSKTHISLITIETLKMFGCLLSSYFSIYVIERISKHFFGWNKKCNCQKCLLERKINENYYIKMILLKPTNSNTAITTPGNVATVMDSHGYNYTEGCCGYYEGKCYYNGL